MPIGAGDGQAVIELNPATPIGMVRLLITDVNPEEPIFTDVQISAFLTAERSIVKLAAASLLDVMARSETLISKKITTQDLSTDGPAVAKELRESAAQLRAEVAAGDVGVDPDEPSLAVLPVWSFPCPDRRFDDSRYF